MPEVVSLGGSWRERERLPSPAVPGQPREPIINSLVTEFLELHFNGGFELLVQLETVLKQ